MRKYLTIQILFVFLTLLLAGLGVSCKDDEEKIGPNEGNLKVELSVAPEILNFSSNTADSATIYITSNGLWRVDATVNWCRFSKYSGEGKDSVTVYVSENDQLNLRNAEIVVSGGEEPAKVQVVQFGREPEFLTFIGNEVIKSGDIPELDYEGYVYNFTFLSNVPFSATLDPTAKNVWVQEQPKSEEEGNSTYPGFARGRWIQVKVHDNEGPARTAYYVLKHTGGEKKDTVYFRQKAYEHFLRFNSDTVYIGSHFRFLNLEGRGDVNWQFEFLNDDHSLAPAGPDWLVNPHKKATTKVLGVPQVLTAGVQTNETNEARHCIVRFFYNNGKQDMENIITLVQLPNNPWASDSLVLMKIAEFNSPDVGLRVEWDVNLPLKDWGNIGWNFDAQGRKRIDRLILGNVGLQNQLTADVANLSELWDLTLAANFLAGPLPEEIGMLDKLEILDITDNYNDVYDYGPVDGGITEIPEAIFTGCKELKILKASKNRLTKVPAGVQVLEKLMELDLSGNKITEFPFSVMGSLTSLQVLRLSSNPYKGEFPDFIFDLPLLEKVVLDYVDFDGDVLPDEFDKLPLLKTFSANCCNLSGSLPASLGKCKRLTAINLDANEKQSTAVFTGTLPKEWGALDSCQAVSVAYNEITGTIPAEWENLLNLWDRTNQHFLGFFLQGNNMSGEIPQGILQHPCWDGRKVDRANPLKGGKIESISMGSLEPEKYIYPQRGGGFPIH